MHTTIPLLQRSFGMSKTQKSVDQPEHENYTSTLQRKRLGSGTREVIDLTTCLQDQDLHDTAKASVGR